MLSKVYVSHQVVVLGWGVEGTGKGFAFLAGFRWKMIFRFFGKSGVELPFLIGFLEKMIF